MDCNDEIDQILGNQMTSNDFDDRHSGSLEELTKDSLDDSGIENPTDFEWDEEHKFQKEKFLDENHITLID